MGTQAGRERKYARRLRAFVVVAVLVLVTATLPRLARAATLTFPGPAPCDTTLQACIDGAASGDVVEIATNGPIDESPLIEKSLTLRAAVGFSPPPVRF